MSQDISEALEINKEVSDIIKGVDVDPVEEDQNDEMDGMNLEIQAVESIGDSQACIDDL